MTQRVVRHSRRPIDQMAIPVEARSIPLGENICVHAVICGRKPIVNNSTLIRRASSTQHTFEVGEHPGQLDLCNVLTVVLHLERAYHRYLLQPRRHGDFHLNNPQTSKVTHLMTARGKFLKQNLSKDVVRLACAGEHRQNP